MFYAKHKLFPSGLCSALPAVSDWALKTGATLKKLVRGLKWKYGVNLPPTQKKIASQDFFSNRRNISTSENGTVDGKNPAPLGGYELLLYLSYTTFSYTLVGA